MSIDSGFQGMADPRNNEPLGQGVERESGARIRLLAQDSLIFSIFEAAQALYRNHPPSSQSLAGPPPSRSCQCNNRDPRDRGPAFA